MTVTSLPRVGRVNGRGQKYLSYSKTPKDENGWVDCTQYLPMDYYMADMKIEGKDKVVKGWMNVARWEGLRLRDGDVVTHWKPAEFHEIRDKSHNKP